MNNREHGRFRFCVFPGYNWCGPGCSGPKPPINEVDAACKMHDECYRNGGDRCECDHALIERVIPLMKEKSPMGKQACLLYHYMRMQTVFTCHKL